MTELIDQILCCKVSNYFTLLNEWDPYEIPNSTINALKDIIISDKFTLYGAYCRLLSIMGLQSFEHEEQIILNVFIQKLRNNYSTTNEFSKMYHLTDELKNILIVLENMPVYAIPLRRDDVGVNHQPVVGNGNDSLNIFTINEVIANNEEIQNIETPIPPTSLSTRYLKVLAFDPSIIINYNYPYPIVMSVLEKLIKTINIDPNLWNSFWIELQQKNPTDETVRQIVDKTNRINAGENYNLLLSILENIRDTTSIDKYEQLLPDILEERTQRNEIPQDTIYVKARIDNNMNDYSTMLKLRLEKEKEVEILRKNEGISGNFLDSNFCSEIRNEEIFSVLRKYRQLKDGMSIIDLGDCIQQIKIIISIFDTYDGKLITLVGDKIKLKNITLPEVDQDKLDELISLSNEFEIKENKYDQFHSNISALEPSKHFDIDAVYYFYAFSQSFTCQLVGRELLSHFATNHLERTEILRRCTAQYTLLSKLNPSEINLLGGICMKKRPSNILLRMMQYVKLFICVNISLLEDYIDGALNSKDIYDDSYSEGRQFHLYTIMYYISLHYKVIIKNNQLLDLCMRLLFLSAESYSGQNFIAYNNISKRKRDPIPKQIFLPKTQYKNLTPVNFTEDELINYITRNDICDVYGSIEEFLAYYKLHDIEKFLWMYSCPRLRETEA